MLRLNDLNGEKGALFHSRRNGSKSTAPKLRMAVTSKANEGIWWGRIVCPAGTGSAEPLQWHTLASGLSWRAGGVRRPVLASRGREAAYWPPAAPGFVARY